MQKYVLYKRNLTKKLIILSRIGKNPALFDLIKQPLFSHNVFTAKPGIMKVIISFLMFLTSTSLVLAQESETRAIDSFRGIKASEAIDVYLKKGTKENVRVEVSGTSLNNVITEISGTYLKIHMREGNYKNRNVKVYVTYVTLEKIAASSASNVFSEDRIKAGTFKIDVSSAASVEVKLDVEDLTVDVSSAGDAVLEGKANSLSVEANSAGEIDAYALEGGVVRASANSGGSVKVNVTKELDAHANSGGSIRYRGTPSKTNTGANSGGSVKKSN
ncbi:MAG: DUF2807 domain-containing protein [Bacteroidia bacterium]|nr:DUF2807 domain-containing protein [Bacteroidia bacterium]